MDPESIVAFMASTAENGRDFGTEWPLGGLRSPTERRERYAVGEKTADARGFAAAWIHTTTSDSDYAEMLVEDWVVEEELTL